MPKPGFTDVTDPIAWLLEFARELEFECDALQAADPPHDLSAIAFFEGRVPAYCSDLENIVFPLLKARLRLTEEQTDNELASVLVVLARQLAELTARWRELAAAETHDPTRSGAIAAYVELWTEHVAAMENHIVPALHALLTQAELRVLGEALERHRGLPWSPPAEQQTVE